MDNVMSVSPGELCDRFSIVTLKLLFLDKNDSYLEEYHSLKKDIAKYAVSFENMFGLLTANMNIWSLERDVRLGKEALMSLEEVGRRAIAIRDINNKRWEIKNKINEECNVSCKERKDTWSKTIPDDCFSTILEKIYKVNEATGSISEVKSRNVDSDMAFLKSFVFLLLNPED